MNEASVSSPLMEKVRELLPGSVVVKHRDASMIGLVDCSVTYGGHVLWLEFKLYEVPASWDWMEEGDALEASATLLAKARKAAPKQFDLACRFRKASACLYVFWLKKTCLFLVDPVSMDCARVDETKQASALLVAAMYTWERTEFPW